MKKMILYIIIFVFLCSICNFSIDYTIGKQITNQSPYYLSFASIGAISLESRMDCWAKIKITSNKEALEKDLKQLLEVLDLPVKSGNFIYETTKQSSSIKYRISDTKNIAYEFIIESDEKLKHTFYVISISSKGKNNDLLKYRKKLDKLIGLQWTYYYLYTGVLNNNLDNKSRMTMIEVILNNLKVNKVDTYTSKNSTSISGYSPIIDDLIPHITVQGKKYNIQIAIKNNGKENKSYVLIGSPLILGDY